jgi:hypothetical protein
VLDKGDLAEVAVAARADSPCIAGRDGGYTVKNIIDVGVDSWEDSPFAVLGYER